MKSAGNFGIAMVVGLLVVVLSAADCVLDRSGQALPDDGTTTTGGQGGVPVGPGPGPGGSGGIAGPGGNGGGGSGGAGGAGGSGGSGGGITVPDALDVAGLQFWHRADQITTMGPGVTAWVDLTGNGHDAMGDATAKRPGVVSDAINNHPAVSFDGVDDFLRIPDAPGLNPGVGSFLYIAVGSYRTTGSDNVWAGKGWNNTGDNWRLFRVPSDRIALYWGDNSQFYQSSEDVMMTDVPYVVGWGVDAATSEVIYILNGAKRSTITTVRGTGTNNSAITLGSDEVGYFSNMYLAEQAFFTRSASTGFADSELDDMITYFRDFYGF